MNLLVRWRLPPRVVVFYVRAAILARRDPWGDFMMTKADDFGFLLRLSRGRQRVVELGTNLGTTAIGLALAESRREVWTFDPFPRDVAPFMSLVHNRVRKRIHWVHERGDAASDPPAGVEFLFVDSSHERQEVVSEFDSWRPRLASNAVVAFHDYSDDFPGVRDAIDVDLALDGKSHGDMFIWRGDQPT